MIFKISLKTCKGNSCLGLAINCCERGEGEKLTRRLSWVKRTATPASTLPTVKETNMMGRKSEEKRLIESDKRKKRTSVGIIGDSLVVVAVVRG